MLRVERDRRRHRGRLEHLGVDAEHRPIALVGDFVHEGFLGPGLGTVGGSYGRGAGTKRKAVRLDDTHNSTTAGLRTIQRSLHPSK